MKIVDTSFAWAQGGTINVKNQTEQELGMIDGELAEAGDPNFILNKLNTTQNSLYNEVENVLAEAGITPDGVNDNQLITAIKDLLDDKADKDLSNVDSNIDYVIESYINGVNWYRKYKSGWIEQGGIINTVSTGNGTLVSLLVNFSNTDYTAIQNADAGTVLATNYYNSLVQLKTVSNFYIKSSGTNQVSWEAKGY